MRSVDTILEEETDDIGLCQAEFNSFQMMLKSTQTSHQLYRVERASGLTEETARLVILASIPGQTKYDPAFVDQLGQSEYHPSKHWQNRSLINNLNNSLKRHRRYLPDDIEVWGQLIEDRTIPLEDLYGEYIRTIKESTELLKLQVDWLKERKETETRGEVIPEEQAVGPEVQPEAIAIQEEQLHLPPFALSGWNLYWTDRRWSIESHHLVGISTQTREETLKELEKIISERVMIKPKSVLRALEFHLQKNVLQRALATRLKYGPEDIREWVKIKRGKSRILLRVTEDGTAIFFAGNRDEIYQ